MTIVSTDQTAMCAPAGSAGPVPMTVWPSVTTVVLGSARDGVSTYARRLAMTRSAMGRPTACVAAERLASVAGVIHVHVNDRLIDGQPDDWRRILLETDRAGSRLVVTLHDLPQEAEGGPRVHRRVLRYRELSAHADLVMVSSRHEQTTAGRFGVSAAIVPHPVFEPIRTGRTRADRARADRSPSLSIAGFIHPGKGLIEFVRELSRVGELIAGWELRLIGEVAQGHESYLAEVRRIAAAIGLAVGVTGSLADAWWEDELRRATVPVAPHLHCSASGSVLSWIGAGRRPLVAANGFTRELASDRPDLLDVVDDGRWADAISRTIASDDGRMCEPDGWRSAESAVEAFDRALAAST